MSFVLALLAPAHATDVVVQYQPPVGRNAFVRFTEVQVGQERAVEVPCGKAPACRLSVTLTPQDADWRVQVRVDEVRRPLFGDERVDLVVQPTFVVASGRVASFFTGGQGPIQGTSPTVWWEQGIHLQ